jgi:hypothetical protein
MCFGVQDKLLCFVTLEGWMLKGIVYDCSKGWVVATFYDCSKGCVFATF